MNVITNAMFEIKFMTGLAIILWKDWWIICILGAQTLLLKARATPKEGRMVISLGWPESAGVRLRWLWDQLMEVLGWQSPPPPHTLPPKVEKERFSFFGTHRLSDCVCLQQVLNLTWSGESDSSLGLESLSCLPHWLLGEQEVVGGLPIFCELLCEDSLFFS